MAKEMPEQDFLSEILSYDRATGKMFWKERPSSFFKDGEHSSAANARKWNAKHAGQEAFTHKMPNGYLCGRINGKSFYAHRIIWKLLTGSDPVQIDHINGYREDNRIENLRDVTNLENCRNQGIRRNNSSGVMGVHWSNTHQKWIARIRDGMSRKTIGYFPSKETAVAARKQAEAALGFHILHGSRPSMEAIR